MGLESYNFRIKRKSGNNKEDVFSILLERGYIEYSSNVYSKKTSAGIIEVEISESISIRIAVPNNPEIINELFYDLTKINSRCGLSVYDYQLKIDVELNDLEIVKKKFTERRKEFLMFYPYIDYPISCEDTIKKIALK